MMRAPRSTCVWCHWIDSQNEMYAEDVGAFLTEPETFLVALYNSQIPSEAQVLSAMMASSCFQPHLCQKLMSSFATCSCGYRQTYQTWLAGRNVDRGLSTVIKSYFGA